eukprot:TRINITY_DN2322_c0_g1_i1.p1 TRINITY_DN2322_c0_g1~~TRINITY_DN2322_c0_g1_i1.p1  ORF type:complete len:940 (+),score=198.94 TRINITY_DN2322_c0_g1_i1:141-2960(+)
MQHQTTSATLPASMPLAAKLRYMIYRGDTNALRNAILEEGFDVNSPLSDGISPLLTAVNTNNSEMVALLCDLGASVEGEDHNHHSALHVAARLNNELIVSILLTHGASLEHLNHLCNTPLHVAAMWRNQAIYDLLVQHGADEHRQNLEGKSPRQYLEGGMYDPIRSPNRRTMENTVPPSPKPPMTDIHSPVTPKPMRAFPGGDAVFRAPHHPTNTDDQSGRVPDSPQTQTSPTIKELATDVSAAVARAAEIEQLTRKLNGSPGTSDAAAARRAAEWGHSEDADDMLTVFDLVDSSDARMVGTRGLSSLPLRDRKAPHPYQPRVNLPIGPLVPDKAAEMTDRDWNTLLAGEIVAPDAQPRPGAPTNLLSQRPARRHGNTAVAEAAAGIPKVILSPSSAQRTAPSPRVLPNETPAPMVHVQAEIDQANAVASVARSRLTGLVDWVESEYSNMAETLRLSKHHHQVGRLPQSPERPSMFGQLPHYLPATRPTLSGAAVKPTSVPAASPSTVQTSPVPSSHNSEPVPSAPPPYQPAKPIQQQQQHQTVGFTHSIPYPPSAKPAYSPQYFTQQTASPVPPAKMQQMGSPAAPQMTTQPTASPVPQATSQVASPAPQAKIEPSPQAVIPSVQAQQQQQPIIKPVQPAESAHHAFGKPVHHATAAAAATTFITSGMRGRRKLLTIGINYPNLPANGGRLEGCVNDSHTIIGLMKSIWGFQDGDIRALTDDQKGYAMPTKANILAGIDWLVKTATYGDSLVFHYSGHGGSDVDVSGDEEDHRDENILPYDFQSAGVITDDELRSRLIMALPAGVKLTALMDCCHSGTGLDLPIVYRLTGDSISVTEAKHYEKAASAEILAMSGCMDSQTSADVRPSGGKAAGAMTTAFKQTVTSRQDLTIAEFLKNMRAELRRGGFEQLCQMSSEVPLDLNRRFDVLSLPTTGAALH